MIILGVLLLILGYIFAIHILWILGIILIILGALLLLAGRLGHPVAGRNYWW